MISKVAIAGASGFVGTALTDFLKKKGIEVIPFVRDKNKEGVYWDPCREIIDTQSLQGVEGVVNLAGESIIGRWSKAKMERIRSSRLKATALLSETLPSISSIKFYAGASAVGYYGNREDEILIENSSPGRGFLSTLCQEWERLHFTLQEKGIRTAVLRFGIILSPKGGALKKMLPPFRLGLGAVLGKGTQWMSWVALEDVIEAFYWIMTSSCEGVYNVVSPQPVKNRTFAKTLGMTLHRPVFISVPSSFLRACLSSGAVMLLNSAQVLPDRLLQETYPFRDPDLEIFLKKYC